MSLQRALGTFGLWAARLTACLAAGMLAGAAHAERYVVHTAAELEDALLEAFDGDEVILRPGVYKTQPVVEGGILMRGERSDGEPAAPGEVVIEGPGKGSTIVVRVPGVRLEHLTVRGYGSSLYDKDAGVRIMDGADDAVLRGLAIEGPGFGVRADRMDRFQMHDCTVTGVSAMHVLDRGDGVFLNYVKNPVLTGNTVRNVRDGFYFENVDSSRSDDNFFTGAQYGIHWMYTRGDSARGNRAAGVRGGYALMSSKRVALHDSDSSDNIEFGVLINVCDDCVVEGNRVARVHNPKGNPALNTEGKGIFIYGAGTGIVRGNDVRDSDIGIGVAMGGEGFAIWENAFIDNEVQVRYVGETPLEWSRDGRGNFWSTHMAWDIDGDGIADRPYQPNDSLDRIFWIYPEARFLMESPVVALLRWLADQFEIDRGKGVTDSRPLITWNERHEEH